MAGIVVKPRSPIFHGHEWIYSYEVQKTYGAPRAGSVITLKDTRDRPLGSAIYNPKAAIVARRISRRKQKLEPEFFRRRIAQAIELRQALAIDPTLCRLVAGDADALPGIFVDRYGAHLILQIQTLAMLPHQQDIAEVLAELLSPSTITLYNHSPALAEEGIEPSTTALLGDIPAAFTLEINGAKFTIDLAQSTQPPFVLDLLDTQANIASSTQGKTLLHCFAGQGAFAIPAALSGAKVTAVCPEAQQLATLKHHAQLSDTDPNLLSLHEHDPYHFLKHCEEKFDHIILTPPCLAATKKAVANALRSYRELHLRSLKLLTQIGTLTTICHSPHISREAFLENIVSSSVDAKRSIRLIANHTQRRDHPILPAIPETEQLFGFSLQLTPSR